MTKFIVNGSMIRVIKDADMAVHKGLPVGTYAISIHPDFGFFLSAVQPFEIPDKLYGDTLEKAKRFLNTFNDRPNTTGALLTGTQGSGKSLVMKVASVLAAKQGISTLIVSSAFCGDAFNQFIQSIDEPCLVIFDEFEKVYEDDKQEQLLTLLDGTYPTKKLIIMTCNDIYKVNRYMNNRPGRLFYCIRYRGVSKEFIVEYCEDKLKDKSKIDSITILASLFDEFNFDMLQALVEELNRYGETVKEAVSILNINVDSASRTNYDISLFVEEKELNKELFWPTTYTNPLAADNISLQIYKNKEDAENEENDEYFVFNLTDGKTKMKSDLSILTYKSDKYTVVFTKQEKRTFDYSSLL